MLGSKTVVTGGRALIYIDCKYNTCKVLYFIATADAGSTKAGLTYLSKYPDTFYNVAIHPVAHTLVMYKLFLSVNNFDSHNKSRHYDLAQEKLWATQCGWIGLCKIVDRGMIITNSWKIFCYGVKRDQYEKFIGTK